MRKLVFVVLQEGVRVVAESVFLCRWILGECVKGTDDS